MGGGCCSCVGDSVGVEVSCDSCMVGSGVEVLSVDKSLVEGGVRCKSRVVGGGKRYLKMKWENVFMKGDMPACKEGISVGEQRFGWKSVYEISGCKYTVSPKMKWKIGLKSECSSYLKELFVFSLNPCILLGSVGT
ncbi:hypothetical protein Tco_0748334 [Tanacetum coccineum]|uniref:Uncharacterized protein n=1 Tax=Tanacetum coccineum TaxID=301880 RepID=A0ABQ4YVH6_9ASTR